MLPEVKSDILPDQPFLYSQSRKKLSVSGAHQDNMGGRD